jgi:hypothetical protein
LRIGLSIPVIREEDSGFDRGDGVRGGFDIDPRGWKKLGWVVNVGLSLERRRPSTAAVDEGAAGVGMGMCNSGGSRCAIFLEMTGIGYGPPTSCVGRYNG